jgi:glycolate oxidase FAD binding subunit
MIASLANEFKERIQAGKPLCIRGAGSKDWYGNALSGEVLDTRSHAGIVAYEPTELFVTEIGRAHV